MVGVSVTPPRQRSPHGIYGDCPIRATQYGLVTSTQALKVMTFARLRHELVVGRLEPVRRAVFRVAGAPESWHQFVLAACLARPGTCASFSTAAALWGLPGFDPEGIEITVPGFNRARLEHVIVHESTVWGDIHTATLRADPGHVGRRARSATQRGARA